MLLIIASKNVGIDGTKTETVTCVCDRCLPQSAISDGKRKMCQVVVFKCVMHIFFIKSERWGVAAATEQILYPR
jgi:hypothetical protein